MTDPNAINPATGKSNAQVLAESTAAAQKAAGSIGETYTQGVGAFKNGVQQTSTTTRQTATQNATTLAGHMATLAAANGANDAAGSTPASLNVVKDMDNGDGTRTVTYSNGDSARVQATRNPDGTESYKEVTDDSSIAPDAVTGQINDAKAYAAKQVDFVNKTLDGLTAGSDAASQMMIQQIKAFYAAKAGEMEDSNSRILAGKTEAGLRNGDARYASDVNNGILTDEQQQGILRLADLQSQALQAISAAQKAQNDEDLTLFNDKMEKIKTINDDLATTISNLHKSVTDQQKQDLETANTQLNMKKTSLDIQTSQAKAAAPALVQELGSMGSADDKASLIQETATQLGIDPMVLYGEVESASQANDKANLDLENTRSLIASRNKTTPSPDNGGTLSVSKEGLLTTASLTTLGAALTNGGTIGGEDYNPRGGDGYVDPGLYNALYTNIKSKFGDTAAQQFLTKYPPKTHINPSNAANAQLDPAIMAAVAAGKKPASSGPPGI